MEIVGRSLYEATDCMRVYIPLGRTMAPATPGLSHQLPRIMVVVDELVGDIEQQFECYIRMSTAESADECLASDGWARGR